jgi:hypothetical protein
MQVELHLLYNTFDISMSAVRMHVGKAALSTSNQLQILYPSRVSASMRFSKLPDRLVPGVRAHMAVGHLEVSVSPEHVELLKTALSQDVDAQRSQEAQCSHAATEVGGLSQLHGWDMHCRH